VSFPKIISGRIGDVIHQGSGWRRCCRLVGWLVVTAHPSAKTDADAFFWIAVCHERASKEPEFRRLVQAALLTGARWGQLCRLVGSDFNPDSGTVTLVSRKGDGSEKRYDVVLTDEGARFFAEARAAVSGNELMFKNIGRVERALERARRKHNQTGGSIVLPDRGEWRASEQERPMEEACRRAKISPPISFHGLRHTWASLAVMNGTPLLVVAQNLGHTDTRMVEKHYGHLAPSYKAAAIRAGAPQFGIKLSNVVSHR
jgi:integrase